MMQEYIIPVGEIVICKSYSVCINYSFCVTSVPAKTSDCRMRGTRRYASGISLGIIASSTI